MPSRSTRPPQRFPAGFIGRRRLPKNEIERIALVGIVGVAAMLTSKVDHLFAAVMGHLTKAVKGTHIEIDRAAAFIGMALIKHHADETANVSDR